MDDFQFLFQSLDGRSDSNFQSICLILSPQCFQNDQNIQHFSKLIQNKNLIISSFEEENFNFNEESYFFITESSKNFFERKSIPYHILKEKSTLESLFKGVIGFLNDKKVNLNEILSETGMRYLNFLENKKTENQDEFELPQVEESDFFHRMIGRSNKMKKMFEKIKKIASSESTVLITGKSGTGKELVAKAIHELSSRKNYRFISINCGAIPADLLESELFGHEKGAFTGAFMERKGRFELAHNGTIFLDEIGDMPFALQVKLLRVLQNRTIERVGGEAEKSVNVRIIAATNKYLENLVFQGLFREDLFYRLNVIPIAVPCLAERKEDIPLLVSYFLEKFSKREGYKEIYFRKDILSLLKDYRWPGNVRELENLIERLVILKEGKMLNLSDFPQKILESSSYKKNKNYNIELPENGIDIREFVSEIETSLILQALEKTQGNKNQASKLLNINRTTLIEKIKKKNILCDNLN